MAELKNTNSYTGFPDETASPETKASPEWLLQYSMAAYYAASQLPYGSLGHASRTLYREIREYCYGRQETELYRVLTNLSEDEYGDALLDRRKMPPVAPKYRRIGISRIEQQGYKINIGTIDPAAAIEMANIQADRKARVMMRQALPDLAGHPSIASMPGEPDDLEGCEIMGMGERLPICADAQYAVRGIFNYNNYEAQRREALAQLFDFGAVAMKDDTETEGISLRVCELGDMVVPYSKYWDFRDMRYCGEIRTMTLPALVALAKGKISKEALEVLWREGGSSESWLTEVEDDKWWGVGKVKVLDLELKSVNIDKAMEWKDKRGNKQYRDAKGERKADFKTETSVPYEDVYRVKWVIGTDIVFDYGRQRNIKRDPRNEAKARLSYHVKAADIHEMMPYSRMQAIIPLVDDIMTYRIKLRDALMKVIPSSWEVDFDQLEDVDLVAGGEKLSPKDNLANWARKGIIITRSKSVNGMAKGDKAALRFLQGGIGNEVQEWANQIIASKAEINEVIGLNPVTDGTTINPKNLNSTNAAMQQGTNNALSDIYFAIKQAEKSTAESVLIRAQDLLRPDAKGKSRAKDLIAIIGSDAARRLGAAPPLDKYHFGITIEDEPTPEEIADFDAALNLAVQREQITIDERFMAKNIAKDNLLKAQVYLSYRVRKNKEAASQEAARREQSNAQFQQQSVQVSEGEKRKSMEAEYQLKGQFSSQEHEQKIAEIEANGSFTLEKARIDATGRVEASTTQAEGRDATNIRDNTGKLIKEGKAEEAYRVSQPADLRSKVIPVTSEEHPALPKAAFSFLQPPPIDDGMAAAPDMQQSQMADAPTMDV